MAWTIRKTLIAVGLITLLIVIVTVTATWILPPGSSRVVKSPDGHTVKLEGWNFKAAPVRYDLPNRPWARRLENLLPNRVKQRFKPFNPEVTVFAMPDFPGEPVLSAAFSIREAPGTSGVGALRVVVLDDQGQEFDPAVQDVNVHSGCWATEIRAFPRRGRELRLRLMDNTRSLGEIRIPNPARGSYPQWRPQTLPVSSDHGLEISLVKFHTYQSGAATFTKDGVYPRTRCTFHVRENGRDSTAWRPVALEVSDATGNHWRSMRDSRLEAVDGTEVLAGFLGALWPGEEAWKLRVEFKRVADFPANELLRIEGIPIPGPEEILQPQRTYEVNGATVEVGAMIGAKVDWDRTVRLNSRRVRDCFTLLIKGRILSQGRRLAFVEATDEHGRILKLEGTLSDPGQVSGQSPDLLPYSFNFRAPPDAHELTLVLAVSQSRFMEFLAKPEQVREDGTVPRN